MAAMSSGERAATTSDGPRFVALVVDDEVNIRHTLRVCLEAEGARVVDAATADAALAAAAREPFDVAFLDLKLGASDGLQLIPQRFHFG